MRLYRVVWMGWTGGGGRVVCGRAEGEALRGVGMWGGARYATAKMMMSSAMRTRMNMVNG